jgi:type IV pilus assembly protein PilN
VYLTSIKQSQQNVTVTGVAQTNERVSELLRNTAYNSPWLERPELIEIKAGNAATRDQRRLFDFSMRVTLKRPQAAAPAASAASSVATAVVASASAPKP